MTHAPLRIDDLSLSFPHKTCFDHFSACVAHSSRIAIIGRNGCGKSSLLNMLMGNFGPGASGNIRIPADAIFGHVPQVIESFDELSGGQRVNEALTQALAADPNILLLDEPTNHLDRRNRKSLLRLLRAYSGTLIVVTHDPELLRNDIDTLWHIDNGTIRAFSGNYDDYMRERLVQRSSIERELSRMERRKKDMHEALMKEQQRAAKSKDKGRRKVENKRWLKSTADLKTMKAEKSQGGKLKEIADEKQRLSSQLAELRLPRTIHPSFSLQAADCGSRSLLTVSNGSVGYPGQPEMLSGLSLNLMAGQKIAISGENGSGKSTLIKALQNDARVLKSGDWYPPASADIGYLDQHYSTLNPEHTVLESLAARVCDWTPGDLRRHLADFLFRTNEEINTRVQQLSGGEKARLSLAVIAAKTPKLLLLDEVTNNLDLETRAHVISVLKDYPGAMIVVSHSMDFLQAIGINECYTVRNSQLMPWQIEAT